MRLIMIEVLDVDVEEATPSGSEPDPELVTATKRVSRMINVNGTRYTTRAVATNSASKAATTLLSSCSFRGR